MSSTIEHNSVLDPDKVTDIEKLCKMSDKKGEDSAFLIFDIDDVVEKVKYWRQKMPRVEPFYAMKCNSDPRLLRILSALNVGFDCASKVEMETIVNLGVSTDRIVYANTCKEFSHLRRAAELKVDLMTFDSEDELLKIKQLYPTAKLLLRLKIVDLTCKMKMDGRFGCDENEVLRLLAASIQHNLSVVGVSFHVGSEIQIDDMTRAMMMCRRTFDTAGKIGIKMYLLDIGGGFPGVLSVRNGFKKSHFDEIAETVNQCIDKHFPSEGALKIIAEPGRYFASSAFTLCAKIIGKKHRFVDNEEEIMYIINEGVYGCFVHLIYHDSQPVLKEMWPGLKDRRRSSIWGQTMDPIDLVVNKCMIPELQVGDWIVFEEAGAYFSVCATNFNGFEKTKVKQVLSKKTRAEIEEMAGSEFVEHYLQKSK